MAKVRFVLKEPKSIEETLVFLFLNFNYKRLKYSTGEKINPKFWNPIDQKARETTKFPEYNEFNSRLDKISTGANNVFRRLQNDGIVPTPEKLKQLLNIEL